MVITVPSCMCVNPFIIASGCGRAVGLTPLVSNVNLRDALMPYEYS